MQLGERDRLVAGLAEALEQPLLLSVIDGLSPSSEIVDASSVPSRAAMTGRLAAGGLGPRRALRHAAAESRAMGRGHWGGERAALDAEARVGCIS